MQMIIWALLVISLIAGTFCQKIIFNNTTFISPCTTGARSGIDRYFINGTIGENITELLAQNWQPIMFIQVLRTSSSQFMPKCQYVIRGATCVPSPTPRCGCLYNTITDQAHFTVNDTVQADDINAIIRAEWQHTNGTSIYSNKNYTLQEIYDVNAGHLTLAVAGVTGNLPSGSCSFSLTLNKSNDLELCCSNTAKPCYPQISFNGVVTKNTETCVTYPTSQLASDGVTGNLDMSYSMCTQTGYIRGNNCSVIQKKPVRLPSLDNNKYKVILPAVIVPVALVIIDAGVAEYFYKTKKRSHAVSNHGTNENADKAHTSEHPKKNRQNPEPINQAYDERRSSPSEVTIDGRASQTVPGNPRQLPPLKGTHTNGQLHPATAESRPASVEIASTKTVKV